MKNFAMTGVAGYIAPRHLSAIADTGNTLVAACDPHDSVGILDRYFPRASFFQEYERFDRHLERLRREDDTHRVHYVSICSPNHLHDAHIRQALRVGADAICEKPIVLNPWNLEALQKLELEYGQKVWTVLQLRVHPAILALKNTLDVIGQTGRRHEVELTYITTRGLWYDYSWKGEIDRSGGIATNIGVHFFDLLLWLFGSVHSNELHISQPRRVGGFLELQLANIRWYLSLEEVDLPEGVRSRGNTTYRSITIDGNELEFTGGFADLHTEVYKSIIDGQGFGIQDAFASIELVHSIRNAVPVGTVDNERMHPCLSKQRL
jgi:UDP-N-acetyl-2-amino-2-deoxyglucuronate dehydrogenase